MVTQIVSVCPETTALVTEDKNGDVKTVTAVIHETAVEGGPQEVTSIVQPGEPKETEQPGEPKETDKSSDKPSGEKPKEPEQPGDKPSGDKPSDEQPSDEQPSDEQPSDEQPSGDAPSGDEPSGDAPAEEPNGTSETVAGEPHPGASTLNSVVPDASAAPEEPQAVSTYEAGASVVKFGALWLVSLALLAVL